MLPLCAHNDSSTTVCSWDRDFGSDEFIYWAECFVVGPRMPPPPPLSSRVSTDQTLLLLHHRQPPNCVFPAVMDPSVNRWAAAIRRPLHCGKETREQWPRRNCSIHLRDEKNIKGNYISANVIGPSCLPSRQINSRVTVILRPTCKRWITIPVWPTPICSCLQ